MKGTTNVVNKRVNEIERINISLLTNQLSHADILGTTFTLTYGNYTKSYTWNGRVTTIEVPAYVTYTITFGGVANYTTPASITYTAQTGNSRTVNAVYTIQKETVTVKCSGLSSGFTLTVKNATSGATIGSQTTTSKSYQIPAGTKYYVTASTVSGYNKPSNSSTYTAIANGTRTITMTYTIQHTGTTNPTNGVWIQDADGYYHTESEWDGTYTPNGIAVITSNCRFVVALEDAYDVGCKWSSKKTTIDGVTSLMDLDTEGDYDGEAQTTTILNTFDENHSVEVPAAYRCRAYTFPNGKKGYLGAVSEWLALWDNIDAFLSLLEKCGGTTLSNSYWTSTQIPPRGYAWIAKNYSYGNTLDSLDKTYYAYVRAFSTI